MASLTCPYCNSDTPSEYNFCVVCDKQIKCLNSNCNKNLVPGKTFCFSCGQPLAATTLPQPQSNKYVRDIKQRGESYEEHTELNMSDHAVSELAPFIAGQVLPRAIRNPSYPSRPNQYIVPPQEASPANNLLEEREIPQLPSPPAEPQQLEAGTIGASRYFERDGDFLVATEKDFKGKTWADQQRHFILLYASAYYEVFQQLVPSKEHFRAAAEKASVNDTNNFTRYVGELTREHLAEVSDGYKLNRRGEREVRNITASMENEQVEPGYEYWTRTPTTKKRYRLSKEDQSRLEEWAQESVELGQLNVRDIKKPRDYAMLALWMITVPLQKAEAVRWNEAYYFLTKKFQTVSATAEAFSNAVSSEHNQNYFRRSGEAYFLSSEAQQKVQEWIANGIPVTSAREDVRSD